MRETKARTTRAFKRRSDMKRLILAAAAAAIFTSGCSSNSSPAAQPSLCPPTPVSPVNLVSPANGATGVAVTVGSLTLTGAQASETGLLTSPGNAAISLGPVTAASSTTQIVSVPQLNAATTYTVVFTGVPNGCGGTTTQTAGSFST